MADSSHSLPKAELISRDIVQQLSSIGNCISEFHQRGYQTTLSSNGICKGACLDWIRRALSAQKKLSYAYAFDSLQGQKRLGKMALTHSAVNQAARKLSEDTDRALPVAESFDSKIGWKQSWIGGLLLWIDPVPELVKERDQQIGAILQKSEEVNRAGLIEACWPEIVSHWNQMVRSSKAPDGVKAKNLSDLKAWGISPVKFADLDDCLSRLFTLQNFKADTCLFVEVVFKRPSKSSAKGNPGHAIAVHRSATGTYTMFDPNFGIYGLSTEDKLMTAFQYLLKEGYPQFGLVAEKIGVVVFSR